MIKNESGIEIIIDKGDYIGEGSYGRVYRLDRDTCYKEFLITPESNNLSNLKKLKSWSHIPSLYTIKDLCFDRDRFCGYTMQYYESVPVSTLSKRYIYENYLKLVELIKKISDERYFLVDLHSGNMIMTKDGIVLIDCDDMDQARRDCTKELIFRMNLDNLGDSIGYYISSYALKNRLDLVRADEMYRALSNGDIDSFNTDEPLFKTYRCY